MLKACMSFLRKGKLAFLLAWMVLIFLLSNDSSSGDRSGVLLNALLNFFAFLGLSPQESWLSFLHFSLRKLAHFSEYFLLFLLLRWNLPRRSSWLAVILAIAYACTDELHQAFVPHRVASPLDVLVDAAGVLAAWLFSRRVACFLLPREGGVE